MKNFLRSLICAGALLWAGAASAQTTFTNSSLDTWAVRNGAEAPTGWQTFDDVLRVAGFPIPAGTTTKTTDKQGGTFAAKLENKNSFLGVPFPGFLILGTRLSESADFPGGIPYTGRPASMQFYYKRTGPVAGIQDDSATVNVVLSKRIGNRTQVIADGAMLLRTATPGTAYALMNLPLTYYSNQTADSLYILFSSGMAENLNTNTALFVDEITMVGTAGPLSTGDAKQNAQLALFPNPSATGRFTLTSTEEPAILTAPLTVSDATGRVVLRQSAGANTGAGRFVDLQGRPAGIYTLRLDTPRGPLTRKLVIQ
ncbi:T9SS type A sorting domain-containing protein [Hymenobacter sp. BT175]|uniref:T9SS type A sorting domain-containing protein n=1 Tax=Hymenobacter translucens TaxID=2886507 RepID=UPI001D0E8141|nr:T9SS type A sorting domain-containing protein [Hymenobacter translucens]MCC2547156.1 T9SS type A sorting domain-containing protein [Hymenobacter translucens]